MGQECPAGGQTALSIREQGRGLPSLSVTCPVPLDLRPGSALPPQAARHGQRPQEPGTPQLCRSPGRTARPLERA